MLRRVAQLATVDVCDVKRHEKMRNLMVILLKEEKGAGVHGIDQNLHLPSTK
jgi:hypothetical protein